jgi:hypothetical protein
LEDNMPRHDSGPIEVTLIVETGAYADGDLLCQAVEIPNLTVENQPAYINSLTVIDYDDQGAAHDFVFFDRNPGNLGVLNAAAALTDTQVGYVQAVVPVAAADYADLGNQQVAQPDFNPRKVRPYNGGTSMWVAAIANGAATYATGRLPIKVGAVRVE